MIELDRHGLTTNPVFKNKDADPTNDWELVAFSPYLDVNGTEDVGAYSVRRRTVFYVNSAGPVNYGNQGSSSTIDAVAAQDIAPYLRTGDSIVTVQ